MLRMELVWGYNARLVYNSQVLAFCAVKVEFWMSKGIPDHVICWAHLSIKGLWSSLAGYMITSRLVTPKRYDSSTVLCATCLATYLWWSCTRTRSVLICGNTRSSTKHSHNHKESRQDTAPSHLCDSQHHCMASPTYSTTCAQSVPLFCQGRLLCGDERPAG